MTAQRYGTIGTISQVCDNTICDPPSSCACERITECLMGLCPQFTVAGLFDKGCTCCSEINTTFTGGAFPPGLCDYGGAAQNEEGAFGRDILTYVDVATGDECCTSGPDGQHRLIFAISVYISDVAIEVRLSVFGYHARESDDPYDLFSFVLDSGIDAAVATLCSGGDVVIPFVAKIGEGYPPGTDAPVSCDMDSGSVTISFVGGCEPPVPPDPPTCDGLTGCTFFPPMVGWFSGFVDCDESETEPGLGAVIIHKLWSALNEVPGSGPVFELVPGESVYASSLCTGSGSEFPWHVILGRPDTSDYSSPGLKIEWKEYTDIPTYHGETYVWCITFYLTCDSMTGKAKISRIVLDTQTWGGDAPTNWPPTSTGTAGSSCIALNSVCEDNDGQLVGDCDIAAQLIRSFYYNKCDDGATSCFIANAVL